MNFVLDKIPARTVKPRTDGLTIISDKGLSLAETENVLSAAGPYIDMVKLAFGTAVVTPGLKEKLQLYRSSGIPVYFGGLLFEAYVIRNQVQDYMKLLDAYQIEWIEVSDGEINVTHDEKCGMIRQFGKLGNVISEIGSKDKDRIKVTPPYKWIEMMQKELDAGSKYIVAEAKETGTDGIYRNSGEVRQGLIEEILTKIPAANIIWEAPVKDQQLFFIKSIGCNANIGNIAHNEVISLETMRVGLRSDSFEFFL